MKRILIALVALALAMNVAADERINNKESLRVCKAAAEAELDAEAALKFKRKSATAVELDRFRHWINVVEVHGQDKTAKKLLCETSRSGELLVLTYQPGQWNI